MNKLIDKTGNIILKIVAAISIIVFAVISVINILGTTYIDMGVNEYKEYARFAFDNYFVTAILVCAFFIILISIDVKWGFGNFETNKLKRVAIIYTIAIGIIWIVAIRGHAVGDQQVVASYASQFVYGNFEGLQKGQYLYIYPHQLGIVFLFSIVYKIFGVDNYQAIMFINVLLAAGTFHILFKILKLLTENKKAHNLYWFMVFGCFPLTFYSFFVYGTIIGLFFSVGGVYLLMKFKENYQIRYLAGSFVCFSMAVIAKSNYQIFVIGAVLVLLFHVLQEKKFRYLIAGAFLMVSLLSPQIINAYYAKVSGMEISKGVPASLFVAMGLQSGDKDNGCGASGWYNGYNRVTFETSGCDPEKADKIAKENISNRLGEFKANPLMATKFLGEKVVTQWSEPTFQIFWMPTVNDNHMEQSKIVSSIVEGDINKILMKLIKIYVLMVWIGNLIYLIFNFRNMDIWKLTLSVIVIGGFLFHMLWEAKALYIMPYFVISLVSGAQGILYMCEKIKRVLPEKITNSNF